MEQTRRAPTGTRVLCRTCVCVAIGRVCSFQRPVIQTPAALCSAKRSRMR